MRQGDRAGVARGNEGGRKEEKEKDRHGDREQWEVTGRGEGRECPELTGR